MSERIPFPEYQALDGLNWSLLKHMHVSAARFRYETTNEREDTPTFQIGRAVHCAVLEPDEFPLRYAVYTGGRRAGKDWEQFKAAHDDRDAILKPDEYRLCLDIRDSVQAHPVAKRLLSQGEVEVTHQWVDEGTGLLCKARLDHVSSVGLSDLKTTTSIDSRDFSNAIARYLYHGQMAHYEAPLAEQLPARIIAVEKTPPFEVAVFRLPEWVMDEGRALVRRLLGDVARCIERDEWPGRYEGEQEIDLPTWAVTESEPDLGGWDL